MKCLATGGPRPAAWMRVQLFLLFLLVSPGVPGFAQDRPAITSVRLEATYVVVTAQVPPGRHKLTLESQSRLGKGAWVPEVVARLDGKGGTWTFRLPRTADFQMLRVQAVAAESFPASFYQGTNDFVGPPTTGGAAGPGPVLGIGPPTDDANTTSAGRAVVESDIWKIQGDTLYFFNQYRGLQVIDISQPDAPKLRGAVSLPGVGEQMYLIDQFAVLLTRDCNSTAGQSEILIVDTTADPPRIVRRLPVTGTIQESRLVGTALYVASQTYRTSQGGPAGQSITWEWGSMVSSFDLTDPTAPTAKDSLWYAGWGNVVMATDRFLFVATQDPATWSKSRLHVLDISDPHGALVARGDVAPFGQVVDKFKLSLMDDVLSVVSETWNDTAQWTTRLENFSLTQPQTPTRLGSVVIKTGERLFATRFDGNRAYVVTYQRIDPLFVVDLSDPANPRVAGHVEVPGWSTYIHPLGDRLVTIGLDNANGWRVSVSLFDVKDPTAPKLLSRVPVGENYSWSDATSDEKAFGILPETGLLLVPYQGYSANGYSSRVQLIDLKADALAARGTIDHTLVPRRATVHGDRVLSLSGRELLAVDAADRDHPVVKAELKLAWRVDRVVLAGQHLLEFNTANNWDTTNSLIRVTAAADPEHILQTTVLDPLPVIGAVARDGHLFVLQGRSDGWWATADGTDPAPPKDKNASLTVFELSALPALQLSARIDLTLDPLGWTSNWMPMWVKPGLLVWAGGGGGGYWGWLTPQLLVGDLFMRPWYGGQGGRFLAFDVTDPKTPKLASDQNLTATDRWSFSPAFTADGKVFLSHETSEFLEGIVPPGYVPEKPIFSKDPLSGQLVTNQAPVGTWVQRFTLDVVDYADPTAPTLRKPASLPGRLTGIAHGSEILYTVGPQFDPVKWTSDWNDWLAASAYDGVTAHLADTLPLPQTWPHPVLIQGEVALIGRPAGSVDVPSVLEAWTLSNGGKLVRVGATPLEMPAQTLVTFGDLLSIVTTGDVALYDATQPTALALIRRQPYSACLGLDLTLADGALGKGVWAPLNDYGVLKINTP